MLSDNEAVLVLRPEGKVDYHFAELDANAINFYLPEPYKYFSIASGIFLEGDEKLDQPEFEIGDQQMHRGGLRAVVFSPGVVELGFDKSKPFLKRYRVVRLLVGDALDRRMVDFFVNYLFFGRIVDYTDDFDTALKVVQTQFPVRLDDLEE
jgi:hypothetical protein